MIATLTTIQEEAVFSLSSHACPGWRKAMFNSCGSAPTDAQERLITAMSATSDPRVAVPVPPTTVRAFRPVLVVHTNRQLHLIA